MGWGLMLPVLLTIIGLTSFVALGHVRQQLTEDKMGISPVVTPIKDFNGRFSIQYLTGIREFKMKRVSLLLYAKI